jgi:hypothetical protein
MNYLKTPLIVLLSFALTCVGVVSAGAHSGGTQTQSTALERGYRTGYSDGYNSGYRDVGDKAARDYQSKDEYQRADRSFNEVWGPIEDYRDGYQQGFEAGYAAGYDRHPFDSSIPSGFRRRALPAARTNAGVSNDTTTPDTTSPDTTIPASPDNSAAGSSSSTMSGSWSIPGNTVLSLELLTPLSTDATQRGDRFQARVVEPAQYAGALVEGRVSEVKRPGKVKGVAELQLTFDQIRSQDNRTADLHAVLIEVVPMGGRDQGAEVDREGGVKGRDTTKDDVSKVGAATGVGAIIGAIAGGGKGAAIGAVIGGAAGTGAVVSTRGKDVRLERGQQLRIRTSNDTSVQ